MNNLDNQQCIEIKQLLADFSSIALSLIFGSAVNQRQRFDSDIDIAVMADTPLLVVSKIAITESVAEKTGRISI